MRSRNIILGGLVALIIIVVVIALFDPIYVGPNTFINFLENSSRTAPFLVLLLIVVEVIVTPFPGSAIPVAAGYVLGSFEGFIYAWLGNVIGASIAFLLVNKFGRPFIKKFIKKESLSFYEDFVNQKRYILWAAYLVPLFPQDVVSFAAGMAKIKFRKFFLGMALAFIPNMLFLSYFGEKLYNIRSREIFTLFFPIIVIALIIILFINFKRKKKI